MSEIKKADIDIQPENQNTVKIPTNKYFRFGLDKKELPESQPTSEETNQKVSKPKLFRFGLTD